MEQMKDRLQVIFDLQQMLDNDIKDKRNLHDISDEEWIQKKVLAMISELSEVLDEVNFKWWKNKKPINAKDLQGELVDLLHFLVSMCLNAGMSADDMFEIYKEKNEENLKRQLGLSSKPGYSINENN